MGKKAHCVVTTALLVIPNHTCSNPCFNLLCLYSTSPASTVLGVSSFLPLMTRNMQRHNYSSTKVTEKGSAWEYVPRLAAS